MISDLDALRAAFDDGFAAAPSPARGAARRYLLVGAGGRPRALRLDEVIAVLALPALAPVPRAHAALLGVGAVRGRATAVFSLAGLLGAEIRPCRWLALIDATLAIAVEDLAGIAEAEAELPRASDLSFTDRAIALTTATVDVIDARALAKTLNPAHAGRKRRPMNSTWTFTRKIGLGVGFALVMLAVLAALAMWTSRTLLDAHRGVDASHALVESLDDLVDATHQAEYHCATYAVSGTSKAAEAARRALAAVPETEKVLDRVAADPALARDAEALRTQLTEELRQLARQIDARAESAEAAAKLAEDENTELEAVERLEQNIETAVRERLRRDSDTATHAAATAENALLLGALAVAATLAIGGALMARALARQVGSAVGEMQSASTELNAAANQQAAGSREQATATTEVTTTIRELLASARQIAESAQRVSRIAEDTAKAAIAGRATVGQAQEAIGSIRRQVDQIVGHMVELGRTSQRIGSILEIIGELAEQTNILAINATIESAGAGEAGRRFAVVAEEIRKLADRVGGSAKEIRPLIEEIRSAANAAVMATEDGSKAVDAGTKRFAEVASSFSGIADSVGVTSEAAREIELSTKQQSTAVEQVNQAVGSVAVAAKQMEASTTQTFQASSRLAALAREMSRLVTTSAA